MIPGHLDVDDIFSLKVDGLKEELVKRGLPKSGSKIELQERLIQYVTSDENRAHALINQSAEEELDVDDLGMEAIEQSLDSDAENSAKDEDKLNLESDIEEDELLKEDEEEAAEEKLLEEQPVEDVEEKKEEAPQDTSIKPAKKVASPIKIKEKIVIKPSSDEEKRKERTKRFGAPTSEDDKKKSRLDRFGSAASSDTTSTTAPVTQSNGHSKDEDKVLKRIQRFGQVAPPSAEKGSEADRIAARKDRFADERIKKRQERFGVVKPDIKSLTNNEEKKKARLLKFGGK